MVQADRLHVFFPPTCPADSHYHTFLTCVSLSQPLPQAFNPSLIFHPCQMLLFQPLFVLVTSHVLAIFRLLTSLVRWLGFAPFWIDYLYLTPKHISVWSCFWIFSGSVLEFLSISCGITSPFLYIWLELARPRLNNSFLFFFLCLLAVCVRTSTVKQQEIIHLTKYLGLSLGSQSVRRKE